MEVKDYIEPKTLWDWVDGKTYRHIQSPLSDCGGVFLTDKETGIDYILNKKSIAEGLQIMSETFPERFSELLTEDGDAVTGDIFIQCCILGGTFHG